MTNNLDGVYDDNNIFAMILRGELPCHKVYEDDIVLAFMDVFPQAPGHVLVVPKAKTTNIIDFPTELWGEYMSRVQMIAIAMKAALEPDGISVFQFNGAAGGQSVFHLHFHLIPRVTGKPLKGHEQTARGDNDELSFLAGKIGAALEKVN